MSDEPEDQENDRIYTDEDLWGEGGKPVLREPDFSDVRKKIFAPLKIILFLIFSTLFWFFYIKYLG